MIIKQVTICGFKSFGPSDVQFRPNAKFNVLIGAAGHGKTNTIEAIEFALNLSSAVCDLRSLVHNAPDNNNVAAAFVEIVFDNSNGLVPNQKNEISIRREIIGDQIKFQLDDKEIDRIELKNVLGLLGFTKSYPFYFYIKQSNIMEMATTNSVQLFHILKEMAGFDDFLRAKEKCFRIIHETNDELELVTNLLSKINVHLQTSERTLNGSEYVKLLQQKNTIEILLEKNKLNEWQQTMDTLTGNRQALINRMANNAVTISELDSQIKEKRAAIKTYAAQCNAFTKEESALTEYLNKAQAVSQQLDTYINTLRLQVGNFDQQKQFSEEYKEFLIRNINVKSEEHGAVLRELAQCKETTSGYSARMDCVQMEYNQIFEEHLSARGIRHLFYTADERNEWINQRINAITVNIAEKSADINKVEGEIRREQAKETELLTESNQAQTSFDELVANRERESEEKKHFSGLKQKLGKLEFEYRQAMTQKNEISRDIAKKQQVFHTLSCELKRKVGQAIYDGIESVRAIVKDNAELSQKYYGMVIERFTCASDVHKIIEVVAKTKIFYHIVDTDQTATQILKAINGRKLPGSPIFMPMNRIRQVNDTDRNRGVLDRLTFDPMFGSVMSNIFGKVNICKNLEHAAAESRIKVGVKCVTFSGDMVEPFGAISGGFIPASSLYIEKYLNVKTSGDTINGLNAKLTEINQKETQLSDEMAILNVTCREMSASFNSNEETIKKAQLALNGLRRRIKTLQTRLHAKEERVINNQSERSDLIDEKNLLEAELSNPILNAEDQLKADQLKAEFDALQSKFDSVKGRQDELTQMDFRMDDFLKNNLRAKYAEVCKNLENLQSSMNKLQTFEEQKSKNIRELAEIDRRLCAHNAKVKSKNEENHVHNQDIQSMLATKRELKKTIDTDQNGLDAVNKQCSDLDTQMKELEVRVSSLTLPDKDVPSSYTNMSESDLNAELIAVQGKISGYNADGFVALKRSIDGFHTEKMNLQQRKTDMMASHLKIRDSIENFDKQLCDSIQQIFLELRRQFLKIFKKFAPRGHGKLVLTGANENGNTIDQLAGVDILVSFVNSTDFVEVGQLADEQKSIVALALILAIQKCSRSPFYLFDCIERSLSLKYKKAILAILKELSAESQVIAMIDDADMLDEGNSYFRVEKDEWKGTSVTNIPKGFAEYLLRNKFHSNLE